MWKMWKSCSFGKFGKFVYIIQFIKDQAKRVFINKMSNNFLIKLTNEIRTILIGTKQATFPWHKNLNSYNNLLLISTTANLRFNEEKNITQYILIKLINIIRTMLIRIIKCDNLSSINHLRLQQVRIVYIDKSFTEKPLLYKKISTNHLNNRF